MNISTSNYVITIQKQNSNIPFKYQVNLPWNTLVGLPKAFQRKTNWKYWIKYIKPIWCPQHLSLHLKMLEESENFIRENEIPWKIVRELAKCSETPTRALAAIVLA